MQIKPRYEGPAVLEVDGVGDPSGPLMRQRRRLVAALASLTEDQWSSPSRCNAWSVQDVVSHLVGTDQFWALSFGAALRGEPTRFLAAFDPVATPAAMVEGMRSMSADEVFTNYAANVDALGKIVTGLDDEQWSMPAEAPPGHVALRVAALHALWDAWVHERDVLLPLALPVSEQPDEMELVLRYLVGLSPGFYAAGGSTRTGTLLVDGTEPAIHLQVDAGTSVRVADAHRTDGARINGRTADLIEALSHRVPLEHSLPADDAWLLVGLAEVFDKV